MQFATILMSDGIPTQSQGRSTREDMEIFLHVSCHISFQANHEYYCSDGTESTGTFYGKTGNNVSLLNEHYDNSKGIPVNVIQNQNFQLSHAISSLVFRREQFIKW
jgi:hypothetical protein